MSIPASSRTRVPAIHRALLRWYQAHARPLPWRRTRDPYRILVSEVMAQQTQIARVLEKYPEFLRAFPTLRRLAEARRSDVIRAWQGMGYNRRAVNLHRLARSLHPLFRLPSAPSGLAGLPGLGPYSSNAIACFAFGAQVATVDTNIRRLLTRLFPRQAARMDIWSLAVDLLPAGRANDWNQGLMELGALVCAARNPCCGDCPLERFCPSAHHVPSPGRRSSSGQWRRGLPDRIYRGRVVDALRRGKGVRSTEVLARQAIPDLRPLERAWFLGLLRGLEKDGLVEVRGTGDRVSVCLPE